MVSQAAELKKALKALKLGPEHGALVAYCQGLAEVIDAHPERATLWREYRPALEVLLAVGEVEADGQAALLKLVSTPVGDTKAPRKKDARAGRSGAGKSDRPTADAVAATSGGRRPRASS